MAKVFVYDTKRSVKRSILALLNSLGWKSIIRSDSSIFVKINMSLDRSYPGANTSLEFIQPLVELLSSRADSVYVGDSNPSACNTDKTFKITGLAGAILSSGGVPINLSKQELVHLNGDGCKYFTKGIKLPRVIIDSDAIISSACVKTHIFTAISSSLKNMFGCLPGRKVLYHDRLDDAIADAVYLTKPVLAVTDGITGMEGNGPVEGRPVSLNLVIGSRDLVSHDSFIASMTGFNPRRIGHIIKCEKRGLGKTVFQTSFDYSQIKKFSPAKIDWVSSIQDLCCKNKTLSNLCYKTPLYELLYRSAKKIKDFRRYLTMKSFNR